MNGRFFSSMQVIASIATGAEKFAKSSEKKANIDVDEVDGAAKEDEEGKRLEKFGSWLEENAREEEVEVEG